MKASVTCHDSGAVQRASGANGLVSEINVAMRSRMSSVMSRATNNLIPDARLAQFSSHHVQRLLAGKPANAFAIAGKFALDDLSSLLAGQRMIN